MGLGNPILGDDGVGWLVASELQKTDNIPSDVTIDCLAIGGISLMEALIDYDRAFIIDAMVTGTVPVGSVNLFNLQDLPDPSAGHTSSPHDTSLQNALEVGRSLGAKLPNDITILTIEAQSVFEFSVELTPSVRSAVPKALKFIQDLLIESTPVKIPNSTNFNAEEE